MVEINSISKNYGQQQVLSNVSFSVNRGEVVGFLGPNGAGKSTLMKIITGYTLPNSGSVRVNGIDVAQHPIASRRTIGYLPEHNPLYLDMYVREYLLFSASANGMRSGQKERVEEVIELTGITPERHKKLGQLSKGYRQRVGLAQAIVHNPDVLILDEPTTGLDPNQLADIRQLITSIGKEKAVVLSTHIMQEVEAVCDRVVIISKGHIAANEPIGNIRSIEKSSFQRIEVGFLEQPSKDALAKLAFIGKCEQLSANFFLLESAISDDIRPLIFKFAVNSNLTIIALQEKQKPLEEVFRSLT